MLELRRADENLMTNQTLDPGDLRAELDLAEIDVNALVWDAHADFVIYRGHVVAPHPEPGVLIIDGEPAFSAAWR